MYSIGNLIWLLFVVSRIIAEIEWFIAGLILCVTIIGIPFGLPVPPNKNDSAFKAKSLNKIYV